MDEYTYIDTLNESIELSTSESLHHINVLLQEQIIPESVKIEFLQNLYYNMNIIMDYIDTQIEIMKPHNE